MNRANPHLETELELISKHLEAGDEVFVLRCAGILEACTANLFHTRPRCFDCKFRFDEGMKKIGLSKDHILILKKNDFEVEIPEFEDIEELKKFRAFDFDVGIAVASTLISELKEPTPNTKQHKFLIFRMIRTAFTVYEGVLDALKQVKPECFYVFNGRLHDMNAALHACKKAGIAFYTHERGANIAKYTLYPNALPHDLSFIKKDIDYHWHDSATDKEEVAKRWFIERRQGVDQAWFSFVKTQKKGMLPECFDIHKRKIALFNSSLNEFAALPGWQHNFFRSEYEVLKEICSSLNDEQQFHLYVRVHPNLKNNINSAQMSQLREISKYNFKNVTFIWPDQHIDTYRLLESCEKIVTFGSTVGIEAVFWGRPSILLGRAGYEDLDCCYSPQNTSELIQLLKADLRPKDKLGAQKYAYWAATRGIPFKKYQPQGFYHGLFEGTRLTRKYHWKNILLGAYKMLKRSQRI